MRKMNSQEIKSPLWFRLTKDESIELMIIAKRKGLFRQNILRAFTQILIQPEEEKNKFEKDLSSLILNRAHFLKEEKNGNT